MRKRGEISQHSSYIDEEGSKKGRKPNGQRRGVGGNEAEGRDLRRRFTCRTEDLERDVVLNLTATEEIRRVVTCVIDKIKANLNNSINSK